VILFLDIDGVLHPDPPQPDQRLRSLPRLVAILRDFPQVEVVISSLWRGHLTLNQLREIFPADLRERIIDVTPIAERVDGWLPARREGEILDWLEASGRAAEPWLALDDAGWQFTQHRDRLVECVFYDGLDDRVEALLRQKLATYERCIAPVEQPRMTTCRIYLDTEFTSLNRYRAQLISLALVVPQGPEFYVELTDNWTLADCSPFVLDTVLPLLDHDKHGRTTDQARAELLAFLQTLGTVEIITDAPDHDWLMLLWLAGPAGLPANVQPEPGLLNIDLDADYSGEEPPHHALQDARMLAQFVERSNLA
jgi:hypothetical protein